MNKKQIISLLKKAYKLTEKYGYKWDDSRHYYMHDWLCGYIHEVKESIEEGKKEKSASSMAALDKCIEELNEHREDVNALLSKAEEARYEVGVYLENDNND